MISVPEHSALCDTIIHHVYCFQMYYTEQGLLSTLCLLRDSSRWPVLAIQALTHLAHVIRTHKLMPTDVWTSVACMWIESVRPKTKQHIDENADLHIYMYVYVFRDVYIYIYEYWCICIYIHIYTYVYTILYIYVYIHIYTHTKRVRVGMRRFSDLMLKLFMYVVRGFVF